jgi:hypothetical protein
MGLLPCCLSPFERNRQKVNTHSDKNHEARRNTEDKADKCTHPTQTVDFLRPAFSGPRGEINPYTYNYANQCRDQPRNREIQLTSFHNWLLLQGWGRRKDDGL